MPSEPDALAFGDIVLVPFPFTDQSATKRSPAVVISGPGYQARHADVILMPVTSQLRGDARPDDIVIEVWKAAGLLKPSAVKPIIATLEQRLILRRLGQLSGADAESLKSSLAALLE